MKSILKSISTLFKPKNRWAKNILNRPLFPDNLIGNVQKQSEEHERYLTVFENSEDAYLLLKDKIIDCNKKACELFGCSSSELINHTPYAFSPVKQPDGNSSIVSAKEKISKAFSTGTQQFYWKHKRKDGTLFDTEVTLKPITINGEVVLFSTIKDISELLVHKEKEEKLLKETRIINESILMFDKLKHPNDIYDFLGNRLLQLLDNSSIVISRFDTKKGKLKIFKIFSPDADSKIAKVIEKTKIDPYKMEYNLPHYSDAELVEFSSGKLTELLNGVHQLTMYSIPKYKSKLIEKMLGIQRVYAMGLTQNGKLFGSLSILRTIDSDLEFKASIETLVNHALTVIHKKYAENALRKNEKEYRFIAENSNDVIWVLDKDNNQIYVSPSVIRIIGFSPEEFKKFSIHEILSSYSYEKLIYHINTYKNQKIKNLPSDGVVSFSLELDLCHKTKGYILTEANVKVIFDKKNNINGFHIISRDISNRKLIEKQLKEVVERNTVLINNLPSGLAIYTSNFKILFANPPFYHLLQYDTKASVTKSHLLEFELFNLPEVNSHINLLISEAKAFDFEVLAYEFNCEKYYLRIRGYAFPSLSKETQSYMMLISNITDRKTVNEKLQKSEQRFKDIYNQSPIGIELYNETGDLIDSNPAALEIYGIVDKDETKNLNLFNNPDIPYWAKDQLILGNTTRFRSTIDFERIKKEDIYKTLLSGVTYLDVMAAPLKSGNQIHGFLLQFMNITDQMIAEGIIEKLKLAFEQTVDGIVITDLDGYIQFANKAWSDLHGYQEEELVGNSISIFQTEDNLFIDEVLLYKVVIETGFKEVEISHKTKDGGNIDLRVTGTLMKDFLGNSLGIIEIARDITKEKKEQQLRAALFQISESLFNVNNINELYIAIYSIINKLMPAKNFYFASYDRDTNIVSFPFFVDEKDPAPESRSNHKGLTEYVIRTGSSMLVPPEKFNKLRKDGEIEGVGFASVDWLGVPLISSNKVVIGVMAVQSYTEGLRYTENDKYILDFISSQVVLAIERKQAEYSLRESETKFRSLAETLSVGIFIHNIRSIYYVNPAFENLIGYSLEDLSHYDFVNIVNPTYQEQFRNKIQNQLTEKLQSERYEFQITTKNGELKWVDYFSTLIDFEGKPSILATISDQTERKNSEEKLKLAKLMIENSPNIIFRLKPDEEWTVDFVSENSTRFGYLPEEFLSGLVTFKSIIYSDDISKVINSVAHEIQIGSQNFYIQYRILTKGNDIKWIDNYFAVQKDEKEEITNYQCVVQDITEKKAAEDALRTTEEMLRKLIENSEYLVILQDLTGKYIYFNGLYQFGTDGKDLIGLKPGEVLDREATNEIMNRLSNVIDNDQVVNVETKMFWAGHELWFLNHSYPVHDVDGKIIAVGTISVDITERKNYELKIINSEKKLREASATKERIFSIIRHDVMGPLGALKNLTEMIYNKPQIFDAEESKDVMKAIKESSTSVYELISTLISWANSQNDEALYHPLSYSISEVINECIQLLSPTAMNKNIELRADIENEMNGYFDKIMITTVIRNLISNALKFTNNEGKVIIEAKKDNHYITVSIKDNGIGIKQANTRKLFEIDSKFTTPGTNNEKGTGLGLNLCKNFIIRNGGEIWVVSEPDKGSVFSFTLPISKEFVKVLNQTSIVAQSSNFADKVILLVDDENINLKVIEEYLSPTHARLLYARDGKEALKIFTEEPKIDLILIDLLMPEMDGFEATKHIRVINPDIPVIAQTSYDLDEHKKRFKQAGGTDYLVKPIIRKSLLETINKYLLLF